MINEKQFLNTISYLGAIYDKEFTEKEIVVWYDMLKEYPEEVLNRSIKDLAKREKFMPKIADIVEECNKYKKLDRFEVLESLRAKNYFKNGDEYLKARQWLEEGTIPEWFKDVLREQYNILLDDNSNNYIKQESTQAPLLGEYNNEKERINKT